MTNKDKNPIKSTSIELLKKIKNLQCDKLYSVASFTKKDDSSRVILSRLADSGIIVKYSRGYFFKPTNKTYTKIQIKWYLLIKHYLQMTFFGVSKMALR